MYCKSGQSKPVFTQALVRQYMLAKLDFMNPFSLLCCPGSLFCGELEKGSAVIGGESGWGWLFHVWLFRRQNLFCAV